MKNSLGFFNRLRQPRTIGSLIMKISNITVLLAAVLLQNVSAQTYPDATLPAWRGDLVVDSRTVEVIP